MVRINKWLLSLDPWHYHLGVVRNLAQPIYVVLKPLTVRTILMMIVVVWFVRIVSETWKN